MTLTQSVRCFAIHRRGRVSFINRACAFVAVVLRAHMSSAQHADHVVYGELVTDVEGRFGRARLDVRGRCVPVPIIRDMQQKKGSNNARLLSSCLRTPTEKTLTLPLCFTIITTHHTHIERERERPRTFADTHMISL
jgi:hypothetical protein